MSSTGAARLPKHLHPRPKATPTASSTALDAAALPNSSNNSSSRESSRSRSQLPRSTPKVLPAPATTSHATPTSKVSSAAATQLVNDGTSDRASLALIRRILFPDPAQLPTASHTAAASGLAGADWTRAASVDEVLPPLTSRNDVDVQLYAILSVIIKDVVRPWYTRITADRTFVDEIVQVVAHCTRGLEQRIRRVDWEAILFDEIPRLVEQHVDAFRIMAQQASTSEGVSGAKSTADQRLEQARTIDHALRPHPAFDPVPMASNPSTIQEQAEHEAAYRRILAHGVFAVLLPADDLRNPALRTLMVDILADLVLGSAVCGKGCDPVTIWGSIATSVPRLTAQYKGGSGERIEKPYPPNSSPQQPELAGSSPVKSSTAPQLRQVSWQDITLTWFSKLLHLLILFTSLLQKIGTGLLNASRTPANRLKTPQFSTSLSNIAGSDEPLQAPLTPPRPILDFSAWTVGARILLLNKRMPWTTGIAALAQYHLTAGWLRIGATNGILDKYLHSLINEHVLQASYVAPALRRVRSLIFPQNTLLSGKGSNPQSRPSEHELQLIRRRAAAALLDAIPPPVAQWFFAQTSSSGSACDQREASLTLGNSSTASTATAESHHALEQARQHHSQVGNTRPNEITIPDPEPIREKMLCDIENTILDIFADPYRNRRLAMGVIELVILRLMPELAGPGGVRAVVREKLGMLPGEDDSSDDEEKDYRDVVNDSGTGVNRTAEKVSASSIKKRGQSTSF